MVEPITHDQPIGRLEGIVEQLDRRLEGIERAIGELGRRIDTLTRWIIGIQIASLIAIGSLLLSILNKLPD